MCGRPWILLSNAAVAFLLNVAAVFLVGAGSGLVLTLAGVFKDILLITGSVLAFGAQITPLQVIGMCQCSVLAKCGLRRFRRRLLDCTRRSHPVQDGRQQVKRYTRLLCPEGRS